MGFSFIRGNGMYHFLKSIFGWDDYQEPETIRTVRFRNGRIVNAEYLLAGVNEIPDGETFGGDKYTLKQTMVWVRVEDAVSTYQGLFHGRCLFQARTVLGKTHYSLKQTPETYYLEDTVGVSFLFEPLK